MRKLILISAAALALLACGCSSDNGLNAIVAGPEYLPENIAPISAPFEMKQLTKPQISELEVDVELVAGELNTATLQKAIDFVAGAGGGTVNVPAGIWPTGRIELKSGVNLHLNAGCELHFSGDIKDYLPVVYTRDEGVNMYSLGACIYANGAHDIAVTGEGKIVGASTDCEIYQRNSAVSLGSDDIPADLPVEERVYDGADGGMVYLPKTISPINCTDVLIEGVTLEGNLYWNVVPQYCERVIIRGVTVSSYGHGRTDGIDVDSSKDVLIEYCSLDCQDDCYTMKSGRGMDGVNTARRTENVVIRNCVALRGAGGYVFGTETAGGIRNVYMTDCLFDGTDMAFRFKTRRPRGGLMEGLYAERVKGHVTKRGFYLDMRGSARWVGELASRYPAREIGVLTPEYCDITIHDVDIDVDETFIDLKAIPEKPLRGFKAYNVKGSAASLGSIEDGDGIVFSDVTVDTPDSLLTIDNVLDADIDLRRPDGTEITVKTIDNE